MERAANICFRRTHYTLTMILHKLLNASRIERENQRMLDDEEPELEQSPHHRLSLTRHRQLYRAPRVLPVAPKKNLQKRLQKEATVATLQDPAPPVPSSRVLDKAAACKPIATSYRAANFRATKPR
ncbi:hypothetical protein MSAN_01075600 [Mycena sanguinolenta]|uniref:Uncharacterized protein n=1 Tax=Mycena sanguinolenta TaxID=230812 RepID=A0A8H6YQ57_9AGAR|nr:hypothetical protein MSAN_01075600 [Mycena sanguinolenta]